MMDKIIHNHLFENFLIEGQWMAGLGVCAKSRRRWGLLEGVCILWFFQEETLILIIDFRIRRGICCLESIHIADIFNIMLLPIVFMRRINAFNMEVLGLLRVKKKRCFLGVTKWIKALIFLEFGGAWRDRSFELLIREFKIVLREL